MNQSDEKINQSHTKFRSKEDNYFEIKIYVYQKNLNDKHYGVLWKHGHIKFFSVIILFSLAKKLLKIALISISIFILWTAYTIWTGQEFSQGDLKEKLIETGEKIKDNTVKKVQDKTQEELSKKFNN